ncbi:carbon-nitrogen hydrolase family protein [Pseudorhodobacter turbinis]|uniref:Carbon-nitrogen hydrolase family protein n=1 Tax=Pseudorhodobacter turbinis TaxID=2500533 RepID=A0A4P8EEK1_9RHOB|nr:carbon-nitrogen hydrolase family protein [Pseudorhodobacter turbinis]QCO55073.1 carbon-nitrogen hydrolase family protein [Pseudorhodobacter turbinis]
MKIALWQTPPHHDVQAALEQLSKAAQHAKAAGAQLMATPEMALGGYNIGPDKCADLATQADGLIAAIKDIATQHDIALVAGLALPGPDRPFNAAIAVDGSGNDLCRYHKTHLYGDVDRAQFTAGNALSPLFDLHGWRIGLAICYDVEFPEVTRSISLQGADLILVPTANMAPFTSVATRLVPARAEENAVFLAYCNYVGQEGSFAYCGLSCVCGPDGNDLARGTASGTDVLIADLDRAALADCRAVLTHLTDRRPELYGAQKELSHDE